MADSQADSQAGFPRAEAGTRSCSTPIEDVAVQAELQPWIPFECLQMGRGNRVAQMETLDLGGRQIVRERQAVPVQKLGVTPADICTVSCCTLDPAVRFTEFHPGEINAVFFLPGRTEFDVFVPGGAHTRYVSFRQEEFLAAVGALDPTAWGREPRHLFTIGGAQQADLEEAVDRWLVLGAVTGVSPHAGLMRRRLLEDISTIVTARNEATPSHLERSRAYRICRMARAFVEEQLAEDAMPSIVEICARVGASRRALEYSFQDYVGISPHEYLRRCRLNRVRAVLRSSDPRQATVSDVAMRFGFFHLGRFAREYARLFGELPSRTLVRAS